LSHDWVWEEFSSVKWYRVKTKNPEEGNSVVELYVQVGTDDLATRSLLDMVDQVNPCLQPALPFHT